MKYDTLLFDVDDTILDFKAAENDALKKLFLTHQLPFTPENKAKYHQVNHKLWQEFESGQRSQEQVVNQRFGLFFGQWDQKVDSYELEQEYRHYLGQGHQLLGNSKTILANLAQKAKLYVVTNGVSKTQYKRLEDAGLLSYFTDVFVSEDTGYQKPMKEFFTYVFDRIPKFESQKTVIIGDSLTSDIAGGIAAGIDTIWLNHKKASGTIQPTYQIQTLAEVYPILSGKV